MKSINNVINFVAISLPTSSPISVYHENNISVTYEKYRYAFHSSYHRGMNCTSILNKPSTVAVCDYYAVESVELLVVDRAATVEDLNHHPEASEYQV